MLESVWVKFEPKKDALKVPGKMDMINSSITALNALAGKISPKVNGGDLDSLKMKETESTVCVNVVAR